MFKFPNKAALDLYTAGAAPVSGLHAVEKDETFYNEKIEYAFKDGTLTRISNPKIEFIKRNTINTFAELDGVTAPVNKNMIIVMKDESTYNKTMWYTYNVDKWVLMGEYKGKTIQRSISKRNSRGAVIAANTDFTIPLEYTPGTQELSIFIEGSKLSSNDFYEVGTTGVLSNKVQFKEAIMVGSEIEFIREVPNNETIEPTYQIVQQKIQDDTLLQQRIFTAKQLGYEYAGTIQDCKKQDLDKKIYWCTVNKKFYRPSLKNIIPNMNGASQIDKDGKTWVASASSTHSAPFQPWYAFNISAEHFWYNIDDGSPISESNTEWLALDMGVSRDFTHIIIKGRPYFDIQIPSSFKVQGSIDGTTWIDLYNTTNKILKWNNLELIPVTGSYRYLRILITKSQGPSEKSVSIGRIKLFNIIEKTWNIADSDWCEVKYDGVKSSVSFVGDTEEPIWIDRSFNVSYIQKISAGIYRVHFEHKLDVADIVPLTDSTQSYDDNDNAYNTRISRGYVPNEEYVDISHGYHTTLNVYTDLKNCFVVVR